MPANISNIVTWVLRLLVTAFFLFAAYMKLSGNPGMVQQAAEKLLAIELNSPPLDGEGLGVG